MPWSTKDLPDSVKNKEWNEHQIEVFVKAANAALKEYGDDGKAIATGIDAADKADEKKNASQFPKMYYARHMQPGVCRYESEDVLVDTDALKRSLPSAIGKPVYVDHQKVDLSKIDKADGYITEAFYNELDGWGWFKIIVTTDAGNQKAEEGWAVSNAYIGLQYGMAGTKNNVPYKRNILELVFTHLAIVQNPRYEGALLKTPEEFKNYQDCKRKELAEYQNSKPSKGIKKMFSIFKNKREEVTQIDEDTMVDLGDGKTVSVKEMMNALANEKKNSKKNEDDQMVDFEGEKIPMKELVASYKKMNAMKKNESETDEEKKKREEKENAQKKNEADEAEKKKKEEEEKKNEEIKKKAEKDKEDKDEKENSAFFNDLKNANENYSSTKREKINAPQSGILRGQNRYGSSTK